MSEDEWELRETRRPKGTHRSRSSETPGADRELLREDGTNRNLGASESRPVDEEALRRRYQSGPASPASAAARQRQLSPGQRLFIETAAELSFDALKEIALPYVRDRILPKAKAKIRTHIAGRKANALSVAQLDLEDVSAVDHRSLSSDDHSADDSTIEYLGESEQAIPMTQNEYSLAQDRLEIAEEYTRRLRWLLAHAEVSNDALGTDQPSRATLQGIRDTPSHDRIVNVLRLEIEIDVDAHSEYVPTAVSIDSANRAQHIESPTVKR
jgi:hypothetical protein